MQELRAVEVRREAGQIQLMRATLELCEAGDEQGHTVGWRVYEGAAFMWTEYALLTANGDRPPHRIKDQLH